MIRSDQRKKMFVKRCRRVPGAIANGLVKWGSCYGWSSARRGFGAGRPRGPGCGHAEVPRRDDGLPSAVPGARHLGLLAPRSASGLGPGPREAAGPAPTAFNRAGEKLRATGESCPGSDTGLAPTAMRARSPRPRGGRSRAPAAVRADGCAGQAASCWQRGACWQATAPEATAASQLVPWTTME